MALSINNVKSAFSSISKINSKGASLLRKDKAIEVAKALKEGLRAPEGAKTYDAVRVGRNFKPDEAYTDIFTFRDKDGQIVKRYIKKVDGKNIKETTKGYETMYPWEKDLDEFGDEIMEIPARKVRSYVRENGKITSISEDVFAVTNEPKPYLTHSRREIVRGDETGWLRSVNYEKLLIEQRRNGEKPVFLKNEYMTDRYGNGSSTLIKSETSSPELEELAKNSFLLPYVSPKNKFANRMAQACIDDADFLISPEVSLYKEASSRGGFYSRSGKVNINLKSSADIAMPRESLTEIIAHETAHAKWDEKCTFYDLYKAGIDDGEFLKMYKKADIPDIKRYQASIDNYITPAQNRQAYKNQFCEKVAFEAGLKGVRKYSALEDKLKETFPNMHGFQFQPPAYEDDLAGLSSLLRSMM